MHQESVRDPCQLDPMALSQACHVTSVEGGVDSI